MIMNGLFDSAPATPAQVPSMAQNIVSTIFQWKQLENQNDLMKVNLQRAQAGQQPIQYGQVPGIIPTIAVAPDQNTAQIGAIGGALLFGLIGIGVLTLMLKK